MTIFVEKLNYAARKYSALVISSLLLSACASEKEVTYTSAGVSQTIKHGQIAAKSNFPIPLYPGAKSFGAIDSKDDSNSDNSQFLMLSSKDRLEDVAEFYKAKLSEDGWKLEKSTSSENIINLSSKKEKLEANVMISKVSDKEGVPETSISLSIAPTDEALTSQPAKEDGNFQPDKFNPPGD